jgi:hypothetical protein
VAVGYRGKLAERERARDVRAQAWTINEIVAELGVSKSSVSVWVRDVEFDEATRAARAGAGPTSGSSRNRLRSCGSLLMVRVGSVIQPIVTC